MRHQHLGGNIAQHRGLEKSAAQAASLSAGDAACAFGQRIGNMCFHFLHRFFFNQRPLVHTFVQAVAQLERGHFFGQARAKRFIHARLHIHAVAAHAGLAAVAEFARQRAFHRFIQIGIVKHDKGRVAAQFEAELFDLLGTIAENLDAHFGGAREADFADNRVLRKHIADFGGAAVDNHKQIFGNARFISQHSLRISTQRRLAGRLHQHGAAHRQRRRGFAGNHGGGEIPRRDGGGNAHRLLDHQHFLRRFHAGKDIAVDAARFFGKPADKACGIIDFTARFCEAFALLHGHDAGEVFFVFLQQPIPVPQNIGPLQRGLRRPRFLRGSGAADQLVECCGRSFAHKRHRAACGRVGYFYAV